MKVKLIFPPSWEVTQPYLSIPSLFSYLKEKGIDVEQFDLNIFTYDRILSPSYLSRAIKIIRERTIKNEYSEEEKKKIHNFEWMNDYLLQNVEKVKAQFRSRDSLNLDVYIKCRGFLEYCLEIWSLAYSPESIEFGYGNYKYDYGEVKNIMRSVDEREKHIFYPIFEDYLDTIIQDIDLIGLSVSGPLQVIPTFILASMIKERIPKLKIILGGSIASRWGESLKGYPELFDLIDGIVMFEGEESLHKLILTLENGDELKDVPNLIYRNHEGKVVINKIGSLVEINSLPCPEFDEERLGLYFWPEPVLPLLTSRGCYWGKCTFCDHAYIYQDHYQKRSKENILYDIKYLQRKYGVQYINFTDEAIRPDALQELVELIEEENLNIFWSTDARFDKDFSRELLQRAYNAGLRIIFFGLESGNPRVLKMIKKGIQTDIVEKILKESYDVGFWNHLFFFFGFPTETFDEAMETIEFISKNEVYIHSTGCGKFALGKYSQVSYSPDEFFIKIDPTQKELAMTSVFKYLKGTDEEKLEELLKRVKAEPMGMFLRQNIIFRDHWVLLIPIDGNIKNRAINDESLCLKPWIYYKIYQDQLMIVDLYWKKIYSLRKEIKSILDLITEGFGVDEIVDKLDYDEEVVENIEFLRKKKIC
ncbi:MAG: radical SAM protein [Halanaerobiales bacterium]|nr:radical SAM protein [Halanaerobiales bacterium]